MPSPVFVRCTSAAFLTFQEIMDAQSPVQGRMSSQRSPNYLHLAPIIQKAIKKAPMPGERYLF